MVLTAETHHWFLQGKRIFTGAVLGAAWESETGTQALSHIKD